MCLILSASTNKSDIAVLVALLNFANQQASLFRLVSALALANPGANEKTVIVLAVFQNSTVSLQLGVEACMAPSMMMLSSVLLDPYCNSYIWR